MQRRGDSPEDERAWFRAMLDRIFGDGGQSKFARFLALMGDRREHASALRSISNIATGATKLPADTAALLMALNDPKRTARMVEKARGDRE